MSPAVSSIPPTQDDETRATCSSCVSPVSDLALKCTHCQAYTHLRCSGLPDYQLVRLLVTQSSYSCVSCVKSKDVKDDKYDQELTRVNETIAKEISIIDQINAEANNSITADIEELNQTDLRTENAIRSQTL